MLYCDKKGKREREKTAQPFEKSLLKATPPKTENPSRGVGGIKRSKHHVYTLVWFLKCCFSCPGKEKRGATLRLSSQFQKRPPVITKNSFSLSYPCMLGAGRRSAFQLCDKTIKIVANYSQFTQFFTECCRIQRAGFDPFKSREPTLFVAVIP